MRRITTGVLRTNMDKRRKYLAFDIETAKVIEGEWRSCRPLGISCAATLLDSEEPVLWHSCSAQQMSQQQAAGLVEYLAEQVDHGYTIVTWNGVGFDFDVFAEESGLVEPCRNLAVGHVDMMFHILCRLGYGVGLDAAARGMNLPGKSAGIDGATAPILWAEGRRSEVLEYVAQDVRITLDLARTCEDCGAFRWITRSGKPRTMPLRQGWLSVELADRLPVPNTSWMDVPWSRAKYTAWLRRGECRGEDPCGQRICGG